MNSLVLKHIPFMTHIPEIAAYLEVGLTQTP